MVRASLKNPYAVVAISLIVVLLGVVSYQKMVVDIFPEINTPVVAVATFYKGMGPSEIEGAITLRLEQLYLQASYVEHIESRSLAGISLIKIYFHPEYDVNAGVAEITSLTYSALRFLPKGMFPPTIIKFGASSLPIAQLTVSSPTLSEKEVRDIAYFTVRPQLGKVPGAAPLPPVGGTIRQITVFLDREKMMGRGVSAGEVVKAVNAENVLIPAANIKVGDFDYNVLSNSMVPLVSGLNDIPIKVVNGVPVFLKNVGTAADSNSVQTNAVRVNGRRAIYVPILKQAGANTIAVIDGVKEAVARLKGLPEDVEVKLIFDQSLYIRNAIATLEHEGLLGAGQTAGYRIRAASSLNFPTVHVIGSAGDTEHISNRPNLQEGGWWAVGGVVSVPIFTGFLIQNQVAEATAQQRYKLGRSSIVEVTQSEVAVTAAETRLAETQYNAKIAEARLRYAVGGI